MRILKIKLFPMFVIMLLMGAFLTMGTTTTYAIAPKAPKAPKADDMPVMLSVDSVWLTGDTLHITVMDDGESQTLELNLSDYVKPGDEYVTIQATDAVGRVSNTIQFKNPYYTKEMLTEIPNGETPASHAPDSDENISAVSGGVKPADGTPFTSDGMGTVIDNVTGEDGKEFFSIDTEDGNTFYLIVDRARNTDNVYLLNAVTENDLASLAKEGDGKVSAVPDTATVSQLPEPSETEEQAEPTPEPEKEDESGTSVIFVIIAVIAVGGAGYYFKVVRPKKNGGSGDYDESEEFDDDDTEADLEDIDEDGEDS